MWGARRWQQAEAEVSPGRSLHLLPSTPGGEGGLWVTGWGPPVLKQLP